MNKDDMIYHIAQMAIDDDAMREYIMDAFELTDEEMIELYGYIQGVLA